jgi:hypothetical protein
MGKHTRHARLLALLLASGLGSPVGCGGNSDSGEDSGVSLTEFPVQFAAGYCDWVYRCCPREQLEHLDSSPFFGNSEDECRTNYSALITLVVPSITESEGQGRLRYDPGVVARCLQALGTSCEGVEILCDSLGEPLVPIGGACRQDGECIDSVCIGETSDADGVCGLPLSVGESCMDDGECVSDRCQGTCAELANNGEHCVTDSDCVSEYCDSSSYQCADAPYASMCSF